MQQIFTNIVLPAFSSIQASIRAFMIGLSNSSCTIFRLRVKMVGVLNTPGVVAGVITGFIVVCLVVDVTGFWLVAWVVILEDTLGLAMRGKHAITDAWKSYRRKWLLTIQHWAISSGTKVCTIVTLVPAEHGRYRLKLRRLNFDPYPSRTRAGPRVTLVATQATMRMS